MPWGHPQCSLSWPSPGPPSPPDPPGQDELIPLPGWVHPPALCLSFPWHTGVSQPSGGLSLGTFTPQQCHGASTSSTQISACGGPREGRRDIWELQGHVPPTPALESRPCCIWHVFICHGAFLWGDNAEGMSINCRAKQECPGLHHPCRARSQPAAVPGATTADLPCAVKWGGC